MNRLTVAEARKKLEVIKVPEGFSWRLDEPYPNWQTWVLEGPSIKIRFDLGGGGHTSFLNEKGRWLTFDRSGIEDSFYWLSLYDTMPEPDLNELVEEQLARVAEAVVKDRDVVDIPGTCFRANKDRVEEWKKLIKSGKVALMTPGGMGTAWHVRSTMPRVRGYNPWRRAPAELETFMGLGELYVESVDWD